MGVLIKIMFVLPMLLLFLLCIPLFILNEIAAEIAQRRIGQKRIGEQPTS